MDWDEVMLGDQTEDLAAIQASYGDGLVRAVLAALPAQDGVVERIAAIRGTVAMQQAVAALRDGDQDELADGLDGYR